MRPVAAGEVVEESHQRVEAFRLVKQERAGTRDEGFFRGRQNAAGEDQHRSFVELRALSNRTQQVEAGAAVLQSDVENQRLDGRISEQPVRLVYCRGGDRALAVGDQKVSHRGPHTLVIVQYEHDGGGSHARSWSVLGNVESHGPWSPCRTTAYPVRRETAPAPIPVLAQPG